jgi:hypothetical protein
MRRRGLNRWFYADRLARRLRVAGGVLALLYLAVHLILLLGRTG